LDCYEILARRGGDMSKIADNDPKVAVLVSECENLGIVHDCNGIVSESGPTCAMKRYEDSHRRKFHPRAF
jgi:hypothetical protein